MRLLKRGLIAFTGLIAVGAGALAVNHWIEVDQVERFYAAHPMLRAMHDASTALNAANPGPQYRQILLQHVPIGTSRVDAFRLLASEGIECSPGRNLDGSTLAVCHAPKRPSHVPRWHIELQLSADNAVTDGRVLALKATAT